MGPWLSYNQKRLLSRVGFGLSVIFVVRFFFFSSSRPSHEIKKHNVLERVTRTDKTLDVQRHPFLQARINRDERDDLLGGWVRTGVMQYWERFQKPFITSKETAHVDTQVVRSAIDDLLSLNGWVAAACPTLNRPFGQNKHEDAYDDIISAGHLYYVAIVIHSADHFLVDQLAVIVQLARRLGAQNLFVSMLDYDSQDATPTLLDLCEAVLTLLSVPFRIRRVPGMTADPAAAYYPLEEAYARNLALEPLRELQEKRDVNFYRVIWLKGFTCPNDILENIKVSQANEAALVCGMDWAEHNGFFIFSDRWRTRDIEGDQFRLSRSSSVASAGPPRDKVGAARYAAHLPFQVFCCESGTHVVDPAQSYYRGISYRQATNYHNLSTTDSAPHWDPEGACMDSTQAWFCRDLWAEAAKEQRELTHSKKPTVKPAQKEKTEKKKIDPKPVEAAKNKADQESLGKLNKRDEPEEVKPIAIGGGEKWQQPKHQEHEDGNAGSDFDAVPEEDVKVLPPVEVPASKWTVPNSNFNPARILVNPRCVTTYAGVSHTQLALDLFGMDKDNDAEGYVAGKYILDDWEGAPESYVCQEQKQTGGRKAVKTQRRMTFSVSDEVERRRVH